VCACVSALVSKSDTNYTTYIIHTYTHTHIYIYTAHTRTACVRAGEDWSRRRMKVCQNYTAATAPGPENHNLRSALYFIIRTTCSTVLSWCYCVCNVYVCRKKIYKSTRLSLVLSSKHSPHSSTPKPMILLLCACSVAATIWIWHDACVWRPRTAVK